MKQKFLFYTQFALLVLMFAIYASKVIYNIFYDDISYLGFSISDYLINYQGGFVRRGLIGDFLYQVFVLHPYSVKQAIMIIDLISLVIFLLLSAWVFLKRNWSLLPIIFPMVCTDGDLLGYRRDFMIMVLCFVIYLCFFKYLKQRNTLLLICSIFLMCLGVLIYEPTFFLTIPALCYVMLFENGKCNKRRIFKTLLVFVFPVAIFLLVCLCKGSVNTSQKIWQSWQDLFIRYPENGFNPNNDIGNGVLWIGHGFMSTVKFHVQFTLRIEEWPSIKMIISLVLLLISYPMIYFITTRVPSLDYKNQILKQNEEGIVLSNFFIIQIIAMLPMLTVLSCDLGRTIPYCMYTAYFLTYFNYEYGLNINIVDFLNSFSCRIQNCISNNKYTSSFLFYLIIYMITPLRGWQSPEISDIVLYKIYVFCRQIISSVL